MKILIVSGYFYPQNTPRAFRTTELVKEFAKQGHDVTVLIPKNNTEHPIFEKEFGITINDLGKQKYKEVDIKKGDKYFILIKRAIRRSLDLFFHYPNIELMFQVKKALKNEKDYKLMISIAAPHPIHWGTAWARTKQNQIAKIWVADCGDPFMGSTTDTFKPPFYFKYIEKYWNKNCDYISVPFEGAKGGYFNEFHHKLKVIPQGFNFDEVKIDAKAYKPNRIPTFAYAGGFIPGARDPKDFIEYLLSLDIDFKFIVYTRTLNMIQPFLELAKGKIELRDYVPRKQLIQELAKMDFIVNFNNGNTTQLPSKLIDYYLIKRPVLSLNSYGFDKEIVWQFLNGEYSQQLIYKNPEQYKIQNICQQFLKLV